MLSVLANNLLLICHVELEHNKKSQNPQYYIENELYRRLNESFCILQLFTYSTKDNVESFGTKSQTS